MPACTAVVNPMHSVVMCRKRQCTTTDHPHFPCHSWAVSDVRASHFEGILRLCRCLLGIPPPDQLWEGLTSAENGGRGVVHRALAAEKAQREMHQTA